MSRDLAFFLKIKMLYLAAKFSLEPYEIGLENQQLIRDYKSWKPSIRLRFLWPNINFLLFFDKRVAFFFG
jgi:hypothetical protein